MRISMGLFNQFCLLLVLGLTVIFYRSTNHFDRQQLLLDAPKDMSAFLEKKEFELRVARAQLDDVKAQTLAVLEKDRSIPSTSLALQNLRSQLRSPASVPAIDLSMLEAEKIKDAFRRKKYFEVSELAEQFLNRNSQNSLVPEVIFFASEAYFLNQQYDKSISSIEKMMTQFPDHVMTGYALLRLGQISEKADQSSEALSIYKIIQSQFKDKNLTNEAALRISHLEE